MSNPKFEVPDHVIDSLARYLLPKLRSFYESKEGQREYRAWMEEQKKAGASDTETPDGQTSK